MYPVVVMDVGLEVHILKPVWTYERYVLVVFYHHNDPVSTGCFMLLFLSLSTHLHRADAHCTLLISAHPASIAHFLLSWWFFQFGGSRHTYMYVTCIHRFLCMLYMIDLRPVIISALYLPIHSLLMWCFIYTLQVTSFLEKLLLYWWRGKNHCSHSECTGGVLSS